MKTEFSRKIFEKSSNIKFHENPSSGSRVVPCGRADGHDETDSRFSQRCDRALKKPTILSGPYTLLLSGTFCPAHLNWCTFLHEQTAITTLNFGRHHTKFSRSGSE
jgi:hypothetical protein